MVGHHSDQCTSAAWSSNIGSDVDLIASSGKDKVVVIWQRPGKNQDWTKRSQIQTEEEVVGVSWNQSGN